MSREEQSNAYLRLAEASCQRHRLRTAAALTLPELGRALEVVVAAPFATDANDARAADIRFWRRECDFAAWGRARVLWQLRRQYADHFAPNA